MNEPNLVEKLAGFIERFVFIKDSQIYRLLALWVIQTHLYQQFEYTGYIFVSSSEPGSGKSLLLEVLHLLVANSSGVLHDPTAATLFRMEGQTQLFDEVDTWTEGGQYLRGILNAGFKRGSTVKRNERQQDGKWKPGDFTIYAPRVLAGIGTRILHDATKERTFMISLVKRTKNERGEKFRSRKVEPEAKELKSAIEHWARQNKDRVTRIYDNAESELPYLAHLRERTMDIVEPLAAILEVAYEGARELQDRRRELLEAVSLTRKDGGEFLVAHAILRELMELSRQEDPLVGSASELAEWCGFLNLDTTEYEIGTVLHRYGFESRSTRRNGSVRKRYELSHAQLVDICNRLI